jgi:hypothetical protein
MVFVLEFLATNHDGSRRTIEIAKQRAKSVRLVADRAKTIMGQDNLRALRADVCVIKDQMGHVLGEVAHD